ncbi:MAG: hypothetical protein R6X27_09825 [Candidatus Desulfacyla sp.]
MKRHQPILLVFLVITTMFLCSCAMVDSVTKTSGSLDTSEGPETFYVGLAGLKLFPEPRFSKACIATLPLHEKVVRDRLEKGFAHVRVVSTGQTGWVNNAHLLWKTSPPPESLPTKPADVAPSPLPEPAPEKSPSQEDVIQDPECSDPDREGRDAAIFNRF